MAQQKEKESQSSTVEQQSGEFPRTDLERTDDRWSTKAQTRDWLLLLLMIAIYLSWAGIIYFLEPGIR